MPRYNPKIDLVFRKLFGSAENEDIVKSLLNGILNCEPKIKNLTIKNPYNLASYVDGKTSIVDIKAVDEAGTWYDIEMQVGEQGFYGQRALYYLSKMYVDQIDGNGPYSSLTKTIGIHLLDFQYFYDDRYRRHFVYKDEETNEHIENLSYHQLYFIELCKFDKSWDDVKTLLERWISFLNKAIKFNSVNDMPETLKQEKDIVNAFEKLDIMGFNKEEREIYEAELKQRRDAEEELRTAKQKGINEGKVEGKAEGIAEGIAIGEAKGKAEGIAIGEAKGRIEIAKNLKSLATPVATIAKVTGLALKEIEDL